MNKFLQRVIAYVVDILVISVFATCLSNIGFINFQLKDYNEVYESYTKDNKEYTEFVKDFKEVYKDKKVEEKEFEKLKEHKSYFGLVEKKYEDKEIKKEEYDEILKKAEEEYSVLYKDYYYQVKKNSAVTNIIYVVVILIYFVGFQSITGGQTLGKKIMKLRVESVKGNEKVTPIQYFIRALVLYNTIFYLLDVIVALTVSKANCYNVLYACGLVQNVIEWIILFMIAMNQDGRGLHDYLAGTIVVNINDSNKKEENIPDAKYEEVKKESKDATVEEVTEVETGMKDKEKVQKEAKKKTTRKTTTTSNSTKKKTTTKKNVKKDAKKESK